MYDSLPGFEEDDDDEFDSLPGFEEEDDDDFEKVEVEGKTFDLSLKKFITKNKVKKSAFVLNRFKT